MPNGLHLKDIRPISTNGGKHATATSVAVPVSNVRHPVNGKKRLWARSMANDHPIGTFKIKHKDTTLSHSFICQMNA